MAGAVNSVAGIVGQDDASKDRRAEVQRRIDAQQALVDEQNKKMEEAKKRQLSISNQNKVDALRRRRGSGSMISGSDTISNDAQQVTLG